MKGTGMRLETRDIETRLAALDGWTFERGALVRVFKFSSFPDAIAFVGRLAFEAERADHHPDLAINYRRVTVTWSTHSEGGVTEKDFAGVAQSNTIARHFLEPQAPSPKP